MRVSIGVRQLSPARAIANANQRNENAPTNILDRRWYTSLLLLGCVLTLTEPLGDPVVRVRGWKLYILDSYVLWRCAIKGTVNIPSERRARG